MFRFLIEFARKWRSHAAELAYPGLVELACLGLAELARVVFAALASLQVFPRDCYCRVRAPLICGGTGIDMVLVNTVHCPFLAVLAMLLKVFPRPKGERAPEGYWHAAGVLCTERSSVLHFHMLPAGFNQDALDLLPGPRSSRRIWRRLNIIKKAE